MWIHRLETRMPCVIMYNHSIDGANVEVWALRRSCLLRFRYLCFTVALRSLYGRFTVALQFLGELLDDLSHIGDIDNVMETNRSRFKIA